ncbi:hypothetical protein [Streptomyces sp. UG1]|uniref:hypothetical protein n=1 Tax=Streptomyces sp. UG1 TaxID=3417652 RepID=UPI003CE8D20B
MAYSAANFPMTHRSPSSSTEVNGGLLLAPARNRSQQQVRERGWRKMVDLEGQLVAVFGEGAVTEEAADVVREHVDALGALPQVVGEPVHLAAEFAYSTRCTGSPTIEPATAADYSGE